MLLEGPAWTERFYGLLPPESQPRWRRVGHDIYRTVGGYVTGNLLISLIAGVSAAIVLLALGVPFAVALGLLVAILDLIPLAGATIAAVIVCAVGFLHSAVAGIVLIVWFVVYQQIENHLLQPAIYGRTVKISPLVVLLAVLIGAKLAGVIGALGAIPVAGAIQILILDLLAERRRRAVGEARSLEPDSGGRTARQLDRRGLRLTGRVRPGHLHGVARVMRQHQRADLVGRADRAAVDRGDHVAGREPRSRRRLPAQHAADRHAGAGRAEEVR